jgi:hypothetical protein
MPNAAPPPGIGDSPLEAVTGVAKNRCYLTSLALWDNFFTVAFYGLKILCCKTAQLRAALRKR